QDLLDGAVERGDVVGREAVGSLEGVEAGEEEAFIDIDVAQAGDEGLIEQGGLDRPFGGGETLEEVGGTEGERLGAEVGVVGIGAQPEDAAEAAGVDEAKLQAVAEVEDEVR